MSNSKIDFQDRVQALANECTENGYDLSVRWVTSDRMWSADIEDTHGGSQVMDFEADTLEVLVEAIEAWLEIN